MKLSVRYLVRRVVGVLILVGAIIAYLVFNPQNYQTEIINAIDIALGAKVSADVIKKGAEKALIELCISSDALKTPLEENGIDFEEETVISREISPVLTFFGFSSSSIFCCCSFS